MNPLVARPRIKVCCIASVEEAELAIAHGVDALGLVSAMPSGPGVINEATIATIAAKVAGRAETFLLTAHTEASDVAAQHHRCATSTIQLVDRLEAGELARLRALLPGIRLVQVIHVRDAASLREAEAIAPQVDALLLDSGNQDLAVKELGGTGRVHDWGISLRIRESAGVPVWLAGGLHAGNAAAAVAAVRPHGLDVCSGLRKDGRLDPDRLRAFLAAVSA